MQSPKYEEAADVRGNRRALLMKLRQALIIALGAIEDYEGMKRSIVPKHKRTKR